MNVPARAPGSGPDVDPAVDATPNPASSDAAPRLGVPAQPSAPGPAVVEPSTAAELLGSALAAWRAALVEAAGGSTLVDVDLLGDAALDLSAAHPSGIAQLFAGRETRLSNLVREGGALASAKRRARAVSARAERYAQRYGIAPTYLAIGVATWTERTTPDIAADDVAALAAVTRPHVPAPRSDHAEGEEGAPTARTVRAPVLLRPVSLRARGSGESDYELTLEPSLEVNPVIARALRSRGALLDPGAVARGAFTGTGFEPRPALQRLMSLGEAVLEDFRLDESLVVGTFVHPGQVLVDDLDSLAGTLDRHEVVAALAGVPDARVRLARPLPDPVRGDRDPDLERGVGDLDPAQQHVLDVLATGEHLFIDAPTGCDVTGTLAAVVADAAASGRSVLYVPGHRRAAAALSGRLDELGLSDLLLDVAPEAGWRTAAGRRLLAAMTLGADPIDTARLSALRRDLVAHREQLRAYVDALHAARLPWGASAYDAQQALARLTATRPAPRTRVRLPVEVARALDAPRREQLASTLERAARLGAFTLRPTDTPWYSADLRTAEAAAQTLARLDRLLTTGLPGVTRRVREVADTTGLLEAGSLTAWGEQLVMLAGIRGALDVFQPMIFERTAADLVAATATKEWRADRGMPMGFWLRRRLRKQARDMVRPGRPVADLHSALIEVQVQRDIWQAHCPAGGWPRLPEGLTTMEAELRDVLADIEALDQVLAATPGGGRLAEIPFAELVDRLQRLQDDAAALETLPERTSTLAELVGAGLGGLVEDFIARRLDPAMAGPELELAWWSTVFEHILTADPALAGYDGAALGALSAEYAALDREHVASLPGPVRSAVVGHVSAALRAYRDQAESLFAELIGDRMTSLRDTVARYPDLVRKLRPVLAAAPMLVPQVLPAGRTVDLVVIDAAAHLPIEIALAAIARGRQVVVVGDARCASGTAVRELADVLPVVALRADASRRDPYLTQFLADHGYAGVLSPTPLPHSAPLVRLDVVEGTGMPDAKTGTVDSTRAEVEHVLEAVLTHALMHPDESLAVITSSPLHAEQVRERVLAEVRDNPALAVFFDARRPEPFVVADLAGVAGLRRDAVLLSLGYGRTPHGRVLHRFGPISAPGGDALLLDALGATRHRLHVVSCFGADDLDRDRLRGPGAQLLLALLEFAARRGSGDTTSLTGGPGADGSTGGAEHASVEPAALQPDATARDAAVAAPANPRPAPAAALNESDRLVLDLAERLWRHGLLVEVDHGLPGGTRIPLVVGHPELPGEMLVAVLTDDDAYVAEQSVRVRDRQIADRLERLGWSTVQVWSAAAFLDPQAEVDRIRRVVQARLVASRPAPVQAPRVPVEPVAQAALPQRLPVGRVVEYAPQTGALPFVLDPHSLTGAIPVVADPAPAASAGPATAGAGQHPEAAGAAPGPTVTWGLDGSGAPTTGGGGAEQPALPVRARPRPPVRSGLPISAYSDDEIDEVVAWLVSDGAERSRDELAAEVRAELGITRRSSRVDAVIASAVRRAPR
ncbi:hypothetical protein [Cellulomonas chengniuliangii]|uniref:Restriction endonuclease type II-like domain-containing protein n=1 Tax=Cellulomonas chengniuliangii TaxID=2968084 RepID=A0ABY5KZT3_9CELL|nr:hypothetical protein [Cellulomonas chengniuliangii]MCC2307172.1 hypothetical protein [Cellulomonas chengniuliangii]UUI76032.1 hypothetical protein NP064_03750 [Cellulomonas chengniuliangii]